MWSKLEGVVQEAVRDDLDAVQPELLNEWWAPALLPERPDVPTDDELAVVSEWTAEGFSAPDPLPPAPDVDLAAFAEWAAPVLERPAEPDLATFSEWSALPMGAAAIERSLALAQAAGIVEAPPARVVRTRAEGTFSITGLALASGHLVFEGITFPHRLTGNPRPEAVRLTMNAEDNVAPGGLVVMADSGFGPSMEGFTLVLAAAGPGRFHARGRYEVGLD